MIFFKIASIYKKTLKTSVFSYNKEYQKHLSQLSPDEAGKRTFCRTETVEFPRVENLCNKNKIEHLL